MQPEEATPRLTQARLIQLLGDRGYPMTPRRLTDWVRRGLLPPMTRSARGPGDGPGAMYYWPDHQVLLRAATLCECLSLRHRTESATLLTWFCGFPYPIGPMRLRWATWQADRLRRTVKYLVGDEPAHVTPADLAEPAAQEEFRSRAGRRLGLRALTVLERTRFDSGYHPAESLSDLDADAVKRALLGFGPSGVGVLSVITTADVGKLLAAYQLSFAAGTLPDRLRRLPEDILLAAREDFELLASPLLALLLEALESPRASFRYSAHAALSNLPRLGILLGERFLLADIAARTHGLADALDETRRLIEGFWATPGVAEGLNEFRGDPAVQNAFVQAFAPPHGDEQGADAGPHLWSLWESQQDLAPARAAMAELWKPISAIWQPHLAPLVKLLEGLGDASAPVLAASSSTQSQ